MTILIGTLCLKVLIRQILTQLSLSPTEIDLNDYINLEQSVIKVSKKLCQHPPSL